MSLPRPIPTGVADVGVVAAHRDPTRPTRRPSAPALEDTQPDMRAIPLGRSPRTAPDLRAVGVDKLPPWALRGQPESASAVDKLAELDPAAIADLEELVRIQIVSANFLLSAARSARAEPLQAVLEAAAEQRRAHASVLRSILALNVIPGAAEERPGTLSLIQDLAVGGFARDDADLVAHVAAQERAVLAVLERTCGSLGDSPTRDTVQAQLAFTSEQARALDQLVGPTG